MGINVINLRIRISLYTPIGVTLSRVHLCFIRNQYKKNISIVSYFIPYCLPRMFRFNNMLHWSVFLTVLFFLVTNDIGAAKHVYRESETFSNNSNTTPNRGELSNEIVKGVSYPGKC